jgi:hypothetical protein
MLLRQNTQGEQHATVTVVLALATNKNDLICAGNRKGGSITVPLTSCLTGLESAVLQLTIFVFICITDLSKPVKQEVSLFSIPYICVTPPKVTKASTVMTIVCCCR